MAGWSLLQVDQFRQAAQLVAGGHTRVCAVGYHLRLTLETFKQLGIENHEDLNCKLRSDRVGNINYHLNIHIPSRLNKTQNTLPWSLTQCSYLSWLLVRHLEMSKILLAGWDIF